MKKIAIMLFLAINSLSAQVSQQWVSTFNGPSNRGDEPKAMTVDVLGNVYVTGFTSTPSMFSSAADFATVKYNTSGVRQWVAYYNGPAAADSSRDEASSIAVDNAGNVYVTGVSYGGAGTNDDYVTIKYNANGVQQWAARYNGPVNSSDAAVAVAVSNSGNVYVTGTSTDVSFIPKIVTIKYDSSGVQRWIARYIGTGDMNAYSTSIKADASENIYVIGSSNHLGSGDNYATVKYNSAGVQQWATQYFGVSNFQDNPYALALDNLGNVYVTGASWGANLDYATIKYNASGVRQWVKRYNGPGSSTDIARAIAVDTSGNVYVTGQSLDTPTAYDYATIKYNSNGDSLWLRRYDFGPGGNRYDVAVALALDRAGNVYVTGSSSSSSFYDFFTVKYSSAGSPLWTQRYNGTGNNDDDAAALALDNSGNVYVTGKSIGDSSNYDYATLKYSQLVGVQQINDLIPERFILYQNYPNPFNPSTRIAFSLPAGQAGVQVSGGAERHGAKGAQFTSLKVFDVLGREVATLVNEMKEPGRYEVQWDAGNFPSGVYFYRLSAGSFLDTKKLILVK